jgi:methylmalonyl-CoA mutase, C-terminal domain
MTAERKIRILIASPGLDGHDRGAKVVAYALRDSGMDVIYLGIHRTTEEIVIAALEEDVDFVGLSMLSGAHMILTEQILKMMEKYQIGDIPLVIGGTIPKKDVTRLKELGVAFVFPTQTPLDKIISALKEYN